MRAGQAGPLCTNSRQCFHKSESSASLNLVAQGLTGPALGGALHESVPTLQQRFMISAYACFKGRTMFYSSVRPQQPAFHQNIDCDPAEIKLCPEESMCWLSGTMLCAGDSKMTQFTP